MQLFPSPQYAQFATLHFTCGMLFHPLGAILHNKPYAYTWIQRGN
ncbi:hypothetical protein [Brevibacillus reuszeri]